MTQYSSLAFKQNGPQHLKDNVTAVHVLVNPVKAEDYATTIGRSIGTAAFTSTDAVITASGEDCRLTLAGKSGIDPSGTAADTDDLAVAYVSGTEIILVMDATDRDIANGTGDTLTVPSAIYTIKENVTV
jgi:hypothetical protein